MKKLTKDDKDYSLTGVEIGAWFAMGVLFLFGVLAMVLGLQII